MIMIRRAQTIYVARYGGIDQWGDTIAGTEWQVPGCMFWPAGSTEETDYQDTTITGYVLLVPDGADIGPADRVRLPGETVPGPGADPYRVAQWAVTGDVGWWASPLSGVRPGGQLKIQRVS